MKNPCISPDLRNLYPAPVHTNLLEAKEIEIMKASEVFERTWNPADYKIDIPVKTPIDVI